MVHELPHPTAPKTPSATWKSPEGQMSRRQTSGHHLARAIVSVCFSVPLGGRMAGMTPHRNSGRPIKTTFQVPQA